MVMKFKRKGEMMNRGKQNGKAEVERDRILVL